MWWGVKGCGVGAQDAANGEQPVELPSSRDGPLVALAFKLEEGRFGQLTYMRIYSGTISKGDNVINVVTGKRIKVPSQIHRRHACDWRVHLLDTLGLTQFHQKALSPNVTGRCTQQSPGISPASVEQTLSNEPSACAGRCRGLCACTATTWRTLQRPARETLLHCLASSAPAVTPSQMAQSGQALTFKETIL